MKNLETNLPLCLLHRSQEPARLEWNMPELWGASQIKLLGEPARLELNMPELWSASQIKFLGEPARLSCEESPPD